MAKPQIRKKQKTHQRKVENSPEELVPFIASPNIFAPKISPLRIFDSEQD
jgi:hypothetical protein